ncbi:MULTISPECIES: DUF2786 domain-containing protein [unclassified Nocardia]|uniref:DUF2786 domain-containing protein n=1 Tax=unclassified Nocardia TaxID=2637762 RepID=UPI001CE49B15|nr:MULTISPECIES: DUF2786 domain-containing protein [unclassified Nocardia]
MGKNRRHRAAAQRARAGGGFTHSALTEAATAEQIEYAILAGAMESARGNPRAAQHFATELAGRGPLTPELERGVDLAARHLIIETYQNGWLPGDIHQAALRRVDEFAVGYLLDTVAAHIEQFAPETVDATWVSQLTEMGAARWWSPEAPHLGQWAGKQLLIPVEALTTVIEALALLFRFPKLALIRPLPGTARPSAGRHRTVDEKVLGRVRGLLAKAESTDFPDEAESLSAKAQELMTKYAIDRALIDAETSAPDLPGARRLWLQTPYVDAKALLVDAVAGANRCRAIFSAEWGFVTIVGDEADLDVVELLTTSLLVQATRAMIANGSDAGRDSHSRSRSFRKSFLIAYATRIGERLSRINDDTIAKSAEPERLLPVLASHQLKVDDAFDALFPTVTAARVSAGSAAGWAAGREAADRAQLVARRPVEKQRG